jgi:hypothetical protein
MYNYLTRSRSEDNVSWMWIQCKYTEQAILKNEDSASQNPWSHSYNGAAERIQAATLLANY